MPELGVMCLPRLDFLEEWVNGRKLAIAPGLLRNSTKIAAQFSGLVQCSQKAPGSDSKL